MLYTLLQVAFTGAIDWSSVTVEVGNTTEPVTPGNWTALKYSNLVSGPYYAIMTTAIVVLIFHK